MVIVSRFYTIWYMPKERNEGGEYVETVSLDDVREVFDDVRGPAVLSADVADRLGCSRETARRKLEELYDQGYVDRRKVSRRVIYWFTGGEPISPEERGTDKAAQRAREVERNQPVTTPEPITETSSPTEDVLKGLDTTDERRDAVRACVDYLREEGSAQKSDFVEEVYPNYPGGYASSGGWWNKIGKEYLQHVADDVEEITPPAGEGSHTWRFVG